MRDPWLLQTSRRKEITVEHLRGNPLKAVHDENLVLGRILFAHVLPIDGTEGGTKTPERKFLELTQQKTPPEKRKRDRNGTPGGSSKKGALEDTVY
jgi:hypothetical protein